MMTRHERWAITQILGRPPRRFPTRRHGRWPHVDAAYMAFIRTLPCLICGAHAEAAHTGHDGGMRYKASDRSAVPLCYRCHRTGARSYHVMGRRAFEACWLLDLDAVVQRLNAQYAARGRGIQTVVG